MLNMKLSPDYVRTTLQEAHGAAGMIFAYAIRAKLVEDNPTEGAAVPKKRRTDEEIKENPIEELYI